MQNKKSAPCCGKYILVVIILIFIISGGILGYFSNKKEAIPVSQKEDIKNEEIQKEKETAPIIPTPPEEKWKKYTSTELGFSIEYPEMVYGVYKCSPQKPFYVPLKVFEDEKNGTVYITQEYYYSDWNSELQNNTGHCKKIIYSLELLQSEWRTSALWGENKPFSLLSEKTFLGWGILISNIKNDVELNKFIKDNYGPGCFAQNKKLWKQNRIYEIEIESEDRDKETDLGTTTCPINYAYKILYAPEKNKIMSIKLGQECTFGTRYISEELYKCYDDEMINSFQFE